MNASNVASAIRRQGRGVTLIRRPGVTGAEEAYPAAAKGVEVEAELQDGATVTAAHRRYEVAAAGLDPICLSALIAEGAETDFGVVEDGVERKVMKIIVKRNRSEVILFALLVRA